MNGIGFAVLALLLPTTAQDLLWGYSGAWEVRRGEGYCTFRYRAKDAAETELFIEQYHGTGMRLEVSGRGWRYRTGPVNLVIETDGAVVDGSTFGAGRDMPPDRNGISTYVAPPTLQRLLAARRVVMRAPGYPGGAPAIEMPPSMTVKPDLDACYAELTARSGGSGEPAATPPRSLGAVSSWTTIDDYPAFARRAQIGGHLRIRLQVNAYARVTGCEVIESTGDARLDANYCMLHRRRARFSAPALDARGRPTRGGFDIVMKLVPPPPPPRIEFNSRVY